MPEIEAMSVTITPLTPAVGAEVGNVDLTSLGIEEFARIEAAWHRHSVLLLRGQELSDDDLLAFSRRFGELDPPPNQERGRQSPPGYPDVYVVSNVLDEKGEPIGALGAGEATWHTDMSYLELPPDASMLYATRCGLTPPRPSSCTRTAGGLATCWSGTTARPCTGATHSTTPRAASCIAPRSKANGSRAPTWRRPDARRGASGGSPWAGS